MSAYMTFKVIHLQEYMNDTLAYTTRVYKLPPQIFTSQETDLHIFQVSRNVHWQMYSCK